jgi:hypothetical protein
MDRMRKCTAKPHFALEECAWISIDLKSLREVARYGAKTDFLPYIARPISAALDLVVAPLLRTVSNTLPCA